MRIVETTGPCSIWPMVLVKSVAPLGWPLQPGIAIDSDPGKKTGHKAAKCIEPAPAAISIELVKASAYHNMVETAAQKWRLANGVV